jgi:hypothetical protein
MAKKGGKSKGFISQGLHSNVSKSVCKAMRRDYMASGERLMNQRRAFNAGRNVMLTIPNPNQNETNRRFIRVPAKQVWKKV